MLVLPCWCFHEDVAMPMIRLRCWRYDTDADAAMLFADDGAVGADAYTYAKADADANGDACTGGYIVADADADDYADAADADAGADADADTDADGADIDINTDLDDAVDDVHVDIHADPDAATLRPTTMQYTEYDPTLLMPMPRYGDADLGGTMLQS